MLKKLNSSHGFGAIEAALILVIIGILGVSGWYVYRNQHKTTPAPMSTSTSSSVETSNTPAVPAWDVTTKIPNGWKTYSNSSQKFSIAYPAAWTVEATTDKTSTIYRNNNNVRYFGAEFKSPTIANADPNVPSSFALTVSNQTLNKDLKDDENVLVYGNDGTGSAVDPKIDGVRSYTFKGHPAVLLSVQIKDKNDGSVEYNQDLLIAADGNVYDFDAASQAKAGPFSNATIAAALSSLNFQ